MSETDQQQPSEFIGYTMTDPAELPIEVATRGRDWMAVNDGKAYGCLPLLMANQYGWFIRCQTDFSVIWNGGPSHTDVTISLSDPHAPQGANILSTFGDGIVTFRLPYLFRTPQGVNLWVKGPTNFFKQGAQALEAVVETDWSPAPFTMSWKILTPNEPVQFRTGEPFCMMVPVRRGLLDSLDPVYKPLQSDAEVLAEFMAASEKRNRSIEQERSVAGPDRRFEADYYKGLRPDGEPFPEHQRKLNVREFKSSPPVSG